MTMNIDLTGFQTWLREWDKADSTIYGYLATVRIFARWFVRRYDGERFSPIAVIPQDVRDYRDEMEKERRSPNTINYHLSALSSYFAWAQDAGLIESDPTDRVKQMAVQKGAPRWMDRREEHRFTRALQQSLQLAEARAAGDLAHPAIVRERRNAAIVALMLAAGLRVSEVVALTFHDLALNERSGHAAVRDSKKKKYREVPLNADVRRVLRDWLEVRPDDKEGNRIFVSHGKDSAGLTTRSVHRVVAKYARQAGLEGVVSPHVLRHTCGHNLVEAGVGIDRVAAILGHEKLDTTAIYTMPSDKELQQEVEKIARE
jgi:integrase/recombinase XerD